MKYLVLLFIAFPLISFSQESSISIVNNYLQEKNVKESEHILFVSISDQILYHIKNNTIVNAYIVSSSKYGTGNRKGSNKTPLGLHKIIEKHGKDTPENGKMIERKYIGEVATIYTDTTKSKTDDITSRILWLEGLESNKNKGSGIDSFNRYIYIHGTSEEGLLGTPASHGCIRMTNKDVIDLYNIVEVGTLVLIL